MEQQESISVRRGTVEAVQPLDSGGGCTKEFVVVRGILSGTVRPVREDSETKVAIPSREIMNLEALDLLLEVRCRRQKIRHDDHRAQTRRHSLAKLQTGQRLRAQAIHDAAIHQGNARVQRWNQSQKGEP